MKPIQTAIESLQAKGLCPRLHVDVTHEHAVLPDFVRDKWISDSLRHEYEAPAPQAPALDPALAKSRDDTKPKKGSRRHRRAGAESPVSPLQGVRPLAPVLAPVGDASEGEEAPAEAAVVEVVASGEQTAQKRRSAFKVIDGGN